MDIYFGNEQKRLGKEQISYMCVQGRLQWCVTRPTTHLYRVSKILKVQILSF